MRIPEIIATIGPASMPLSVLKKMKAEGMAFGRVNTKYGSVEEYCEILETLRGLKCKIIFDIKDLKYIDWLKSQKFDYLALSFTESARQIKEIRKLIDVKIIAKIETQKGVDNIKEIIREADGVMVARGDLGRHVPIEELPIFQKRIIRECNRQNKFVITATEMLLSMTKSKVPERAEVSDIANAVLDGSNALMLSEETAIGKYPVLCVNMMQRIIKETVKMKDKTYL
ncbi:Pyruvate kinase [uncultured archaeon]|nr:Pyruvate kinase [uncultured archaeon]